MSFYLSLGVTFEIFFILIAAFSEIRRYIVSLTEAYVYTTVLILAIFSVSLHFFFLFGVHRFYPIFEALLVCGAIYLIFRNRLILIESWISIKFFIDNSPFYSFSIIFFGVCLFVKGFLLPPTTYDSMTYHLPRIMMMQSKGHLFLDNFSDYRQDIMPIGYDILNFLYLRFFTDYGLTTFGFLSYTMILSGIFALVIKLFSDVQFSKIICFISASLTMFIVHAWSTKNDLILAALAIACFLSAYNFLRDGGFIHLFMLLVALTFGLNVKFTFGGFFLPFIFLYGILFLRKIGLKPLFAQINKKNFKYILFLILPISNISMICLILFHNYSNYGAFMGPHFFWDAFSVSGGWAGSFLNLIRYSFQAIDLPKEFGGDMLTQFHNLVLGKYYSTGVLVPEYIPVKLSGFLNPTDVCAWFGLLGMPILISILFTSILGKEFLRIIALSVFIYAIMIGVKAPWTPWTGRYFALTFAGGMVCFAFMLKWIEKKSFRISKFIIGFALIISILNLSYLAFYVNVANFDQIRHQFKDRNNNMYSKYYSKKGWDFIVEKIPPGSKVLLVTGTDTPIFPIFLRRPDLNITVTGAPDTLYSGNMYTGDMYKEKFKLRGKEYNLSKYSDFKTVQSFYDYTIPLNVPKKYHEYSYKR